MQMFLPLGHFAWVPHLSMQGQRSDLLATRDLPRCVVHMCTLMVGVHAFQPLGEFCHSSTHRVACNPCAPHAEGIKGGVCTSCPQISFQPQSHILCDSEEETKDRMRMCIWATHLELQLLAYNFFPSTACP